MQHNIDDISWSSMEHAYGPANNIPELLTKIASNDAKAVSKLSECIAHQGWLVPEVSLAVVPFLIERISVTSNATKAKLIGLLTDLACMGSYEHFLKQGMKGKLFQEFLASNKAVIAVRESIIAEANVLVACLKDSNTAVRAAAAQFMAVAMQKPTTLVKQLEVEKNKTAKADMLIALGWLIESRDDPDTQILESHLSHKDDVVRFGAAIGLAYLAPLSDSLLQLLYDAMEADAVKQSVWCNGHYYLMVVEILLQRTTEPGHSHVLLTAFSHVPRFAQFDVVANLLRDNFKREMKSMVKPPKVERLSELQKSILTLIVENELGGSSIEFCLKELGMPTSPPGVSLYLGIPLPVELIDSKSITFEGVTGSLRETIERCCTAAKPEEVNEENVKKLAEAIAAETEISQFMEMAFNLSKPFKKERHLLVFYFLLAGGKAIESVLSTSINQLLERGGTQYYYAENESRKGMYYCTGDSLLVILYWTALHHINPQHAVPTTVERHPVQKEPRSLKYMYWSHGVRIYSGYQASLLFKKAFDACKAVWPDIQMYSLINEFGWDVNEFR